MENNGLERIIGFETERGSKYRYQDNKVIRTKYTGKEDEFNLNVFIPPYSELDSKTKSKLEKLYDIKSEWAYAHFIEEAAYDRSIYRSHVFSFEDGKFKKIDSDKEAEGKEVYFVSIYRNETEPKSKIAFLVKAEKSPKEGYSPYQENNTKKDTYVYHLGDRVSRIYKSKP
ncbi:MAG: hypothetical protein ACP5MV_00175 [Candidatus Parvarchaeum sp.]